MDSHSTPAENPRHNHNRFIGAGKCSSCGASIGCPRIDQVNCALQGATVKCRSVYASLSRFTNLEETRPWGCT